MPRPDNRKVFLGLDPGIRSIGYGLIESRGGSLSLLDAGLLVPADRTSRYRDVAVALEKMLERWRPAAIGIETIIFARNTKTAIGVAEMIGILKLVAEGAGIPCMEFSPPEVKHAITGSGAAPKPALAKMVTAILGEKEIPTPHHAADALAIALTVERYASFGGLTRQPSSL